MRIALLHPGSPTAEGSGAVHSATLIGESLCSLGHDVVFYCPGKVENHYTKVKTRELEIGNSALKNKYAKINDAILEIEDELSSFDIFHSYLMRTIPSVGEISDKNPSISTVVSLNAYGALCPKNDLLFNNERECHSNGSLRCTSCVYNSMRELPPKPDRGFIYRGGRVLHHTIKNIKNYPIVSDVPNYKDNIDGFQALSRHVKGTYEDFGFPAERIEVIPNILDDRFLVSHTSKFSSPLQLLYVGDLKKHKGVDKLPYMLNQLNSLSDRDYELSVIGKGPLKNDIVESIDDLGLEDYISMHGFVEHENLPELYASHDIFVYPGRWQEPFGRVFLESLAAGTPVISTDVGAVSEIIGGGGETAEGVDEVINKILSLSDEQLQEYSKQAVSEAKKFEQNAVVAEIEELYEKIN